MRDNARRKRGEATSATPAKPEETTAQGDPPDDGYRVCFLRLSDGRSPVREWLDNLRDPTARDRIRARLLRLKMGMEGQIRNLSGGITEIKIDYGPGYRIYYARKNGMTVLLGHTEFVLVRGGDKNTQQSDIESAQTLWKVYENVDTSTFDEF